MLEPYFGHSVMTRFMEQDISDDEMIGVNQQLLSLNNLNTFIGSCYLISSVVMFCNLSLKIDYYLIFVFIFMLSLFYQIKIYDKQKPIKF